MKRVIWLVLFLFACSSAVWAEGKTPATSLDPEAVAVANKAMANIYKELLKAKPKFKHLKNFDENVLYENKYGIYTILYKYQPEEGEDKRMSNYEFGITIDRLQDQTFADKKGTFNLAFPLLGLKFSGYQTRQSAKTQYDVMQAINTNGAILSDYQQKFMPLQLSIRTFKDTYRIKEDIEFEVTLKNVSKRHMYVKSLGMDTLYFLFEDMVWGTNPASEEHGGQDLILKSGESLTLKFKGESFQKPRDLEIYCAYRMSIDGVNPSARLRIKIVDDPEHPTEPSVAPGSYAQ